MHYAGARYYMSALGRWNGTDPLADKNYNDSPYTYVVNNPVLFLDPTGRNTTRDSRRMSQDEVITATSTTTAGGLAIIDGAVTSTGSKTAAKAVSRAGGTASIRLVGFSIYDDPSRENVVSELSTTAGGAAGGALGGLFCGAGSAATAGAASGSCMITIPGGAAIGTVLGI